MLQAFAEAHKREQHACRGGLSKVATLVHRGDQELTDPNLRQSRQFVRRNPAIKLSRAVLSSTLLSIYVLLFASPAKAKSSASHDYVLSRHFNLSDEHEEDIKWVILICGPILAFVSLACFLTFAVSSTLVPTEVNSIADIWRHTVLYNAPAGKGQHSRAATGRQSNAGPPTGPSRRHAQPLKVHEIVPAQEKPSRAVRRRLCLCLLFLFL